MKTLPPLREKTEYWTPIERVLREWMLKTVFIPLLKVIDIPKDRLKNAKQSEIIAALARAQITYVDGHFEGRFNSRLTKEFRALGAKFSPKNGWWLLPPAQLPIDLRAAISVNRSRFLAMAAKADDTLRRIEINEPDITKLLDLSLFKMDRDFMSNTRRIGVQTPITPEAAEHIRRTYTNNRALSIKAKRDGLDVGKWAEAEVKSLREAVKLNTLDYGLRRERLVKDIQERFGVTARKAKFLARQETSLLMSAFQQKRYLDAGVPEYKWVCVAGSVESPVRPDHKALNERIFTWNDPPIVDKKTGRRAHPKQDFNCRCTAIPVIR